MGLDMYINRTHSKRIDKDGKETNEPIVATDKETTPYVVYAEGEGFLAKGCGKPTMDNPLFVNVAEEAQTFTMREALETAHLIARLYSTAYVMKKCVKVYKSSL